MGNQIHNTSEVEIFTLQAKPGEYQSLPTADLINSSLEANFNIANDHAYLVVKVNKFCCDEDWF